MGKPVADRDARAALGEPSASASLSLEELRKHAADLGLELRAIRATLKELRFRGGSALVRLRDPDEFVTLSAVGSEYALGEGRVQGGVHSNEIFSERFTGDALVPVCKGEPQSWLWIHEPVRRVAASGVNTIITERAELTNRGPQTLELSVDSTSCTCSQATLTTTSLAPGDTAAADVTMRVDSWGSRSVSVSLRTNDPQWPLMDFGFYVRMPFGAAPRPARLRMHCREGEQGTRTVALLLRHGAALVKCSTRQRFTAAEPARLVPGEEADVQYVAVAVEAAAPPGPFSDELVMEVTGAGGDQVVVPIEGLVEPDIIVEPTTMFLGRVSSGSVVKRTIVVRSRSGRGLSVESADPSSTSVTVSAAQRDSRPRHEFEVEVHVHGQPGTVVEHRVKLRLSGGREQEVAIIGMIPDRGANAPDAVR